MTQVDAKRPVPDTAPDAAQKRKALETAMSQIEKQFGKGSIMKLGTDNKLEVQVIPTGSLSLDLALGVGGVPRGRIVEVYAPSPAARRRSPCTSSPRLRSSAAPPPLSTPSTPSTQCTPRRSA
jgi:recombination protein RecA